ncbi:MAG: AMP-binding protein [Gammaproteobacteria bacterium]|jgi:long-chain acyl-CoA synthetase|nr:AMP-dependent synthetase [Chromatiales bacterium]MDP6674382.1 AMP-binding protein [Gammaproteobacteria bacterium]
MSELPFSFRHLSLAGGVRAAASRDPGKLAYRHRERTRTYAQLIDRIDRVTTALSADLGLHNGDHGAIVAQNSIEYMEIVIGAAQAGVALATVNPKLSALEIKAICEDANARVLFIDGDSAEQLADMDIDGIERTVVIDNEFEDWLSNVNSIVIPVVEEWGTFTIPYTSGTTGKPKGVLVPHRSRILSIFAMASEYGCYAPDDRFLAIAPMCHGAGMIFSLAPVFIGGYAEIMDAFDPEQVMVKLKNESMTGFFGVPTHFNVIFSLEQTFLDEHRPADLKTVISNAAALPQAMKETLVEFFGPGILHETYGSTEAGIVLNLRPADQLRKKACVGQPIPGTLVSVRDESGNECATDEVGELFSSSPYLFNGYWKRPEETVEAYQDGWVTVGDLVRRDAEGYLYIVDRKKDMVISGGVNIYPREIEEVMITHPEVVDVAVIGVPDEKWGESLKAYVVSKSGATTDKEALMEFCESKISRMKTPRDIEYIDAIPRNATGKVLKTDLRKRD